MARVARHAVTRLRFLITAGPTREYIDPVRFLSNDSSGRMGFAIAAAAGRRGHRVTLVHGPVALAVPAGVQSVAVVSADEMARACEVEWARADVLIMSAAVADYSVVRRSRSKLKKSARLLTLRLRPTPDILAALARKRRDDQTVVGFALESHDGRRNAESKLSRKKLDAIVLNSAAAMGADGSRVEVLTRDGVWRCLPAQRKSQTAGWLVRFAERLHTAR